MAYKRKDSWYLKAKQNGFRARSAYKLMELHRRAKLFVPGMRVVDLGCAPGGWLQVAAKEVGRKGKIVGVDRNAVGLTGYHQVVTIEGDVTQEEIWKRIEKEIGQEADVVMSDLAPNTSGVKCTDHARSVELVRLAISLACRLLRKNGCFVAKVFEGPDVKDLVEDLSGLFGNVRRVRLEATRKESSEIYLIAKPFLGIASGER